ncbi:hypothetical protein WA158_005925 [Blastocystis sp. Blastoise]
MSSIKACLFALITLFAVNVVYAKMFPTFVNNQFVDLAKPFFASQTVDCAIKITAWKYAKKILPELNDNQAVFDAFQLQVCGLERPKEDPVMRRPKEKWTYPGEALYVDGTNGSDKNDGSFEHPLQTIPRAIKRSRDIDGKKVIYIRAGYYYVEKAIILGPQDEYLTITSYQDEEVILSGAKKISVDWKEYAVNQWRIQKNKNILLNMKLTPGEDVPNRALYKGKYENQLECQEVCQNSTECTAYVYYPKNSEINTSEMCYLIINNENYLFKDETAISGIKLNILKTDLSNYNIHSMNQLYINKQRQTLARYPNSNAEIQGYHTDPSGFISDSYGSWKSPEEKKHAYQYTVSEPHLEGTLYNNYNMAYGGEAYRWNPPMSYWALDYPRGGGGCTYRIPTGIDISDEILPTMDNSTINFNDNKPILHAFHYGYWGFWMFEMDTFERSEITAGDAHIKWTKGGYQEARGGSHGGNFFMENLFSELDSANEWYFDTKTQSLYWYPNSTYTNINEIYIPTNGHIFEIYIYILLCLLCLLCYYIYGSQTLPVHDITISGIQFSYTPTTYMNEFYIPSGGDVAIQKGAVVYMEGVHDIIIEYNTFTKLGNNAIFTYSYVENCNIHHNNIYNGGDSGIILQGTSQHIDGTDGNHPHGNTLEYNIIHDLGIYLKQSAPIIQSKSARTIMRGNIIFNVPRAGILINDAFGGGNLLENNIIFNTVRETADHGPINTWDRIPFVTNYRENKPSMMPQQTNITRNFIFANYHSVWPLDHDDGSCYYYDTYNVLVYGGFKNYLAMHNLYIYPDTKYAGDSNEFFTEPHCINSGGQSIGESGWGDVYQYNECILKNNAVYMETGCSTNPEELKQLAVDSDYNTIYTPHGEKDSIILCGSLKWNFTTYRNYGFDLHTTFKPLPTAAEIAEKASEMLSIDN